MIEFPWPPPQVFPNFKRAHHWTKYRPHEASYRLACKGLTKAARIRPEPGLIPMTVTFFPPDRRKRDDDGMIGAFKNGRDGMADAWGVDDTTFRPTYRIAEPIKGGKITVEVA